MGDNNEEIMDLLQQRLALGKERYGHGVRINDDTREFGTNDNSWETMMLEEALDGMIYAAAAMLRVKRARSNVVNVSQQVDGYTVRRLDDGYTCTCPNFTYRINTPVPQNKGCKHIVSASV